MQRISHGEAARAALAQKRGAMSLWVDAIKRDMRTGLRSNDPLPGDVYKFTPEPACPCACHFDPDPTCNIFDFLAFQNLFVAGDPCACDIDPDPACNIFDFLAFQNQFVMGCP